MTKLEIVTLVAKLLILMMAFATLLSLFTTSALIERQQKILDQQLLIIENINGINRNLANLGIYYVVSEKEDNYE